jgi:hypothetical protein
MNINDLGTIANLMSAIAVLATLIYLSRQVKQGNMLARSESRQRMAVQAQEELYQWMGDAQLRECFAKPTELSREEQGKMHYFLLAAMRARETEWFHYRDGAMAEDVYRAYHEVIGLHLGIPRTRRWWSTVGRVGFDPAFVAEVDRLLEGRAPITYFEDILKFDIQPVKAS